MPTTYTNSVAYLNAQHWIDAEKLGYINEIFYGTSPLGMVPILPANGFMRHQFMIRGYETAKRTQKRKLNEAPDAKSGNPFRKTDELTTIFSTRTDIDKKQARHMPEMYDQMLLSDAKLLMMDIDKY